MKHITDEQLEKNLDVFSTMKEVGVPDFYYTRLSARMENELATNELALFIKPLLVICTLTLFLFINSLLLKKDTSLATSDTSQNIEALAVAYDQTISN